jgi:CBS domain-containing protein/PII-like signaling protein
VSLLRQGKAQALTIYLGESDQWRGGSLYVAIIQYLREQGCAGATVTRAVAGFGAGARLHESGGLRLSSEASLVIQVIDQPARLQRLLPHLQEMLNGGMLTLHDVEVLKYTHARRHGLSTKVQVQQVMETLVTSVQMETPIATVIDLLLNAPFRVLPVLDGQGRLQGIISTGDLINAGVLPMRRRLVRTALELDERSAETVEEPMEQARQGSRTAQEIMNRQIRTVRPEQPVREAAQLMLESGLRRLPVVASDGRLVGMLTRADLLQVVITSPLMSPEASSATQPLSHGSLPLQQRTLADYINPDVATVNEQTALDEVIDALILSPLKRVVVVDAGQRVKGIISDVDVLARLQEDMRPGLLSALAGWAGGRRRSGSLRTHAGKAQVAADIMYREVVTVAATATVQETIEQMLALHRKFLPVVDADGRLVGTVGRSALLRVLVEG